MCLWQCDAWSCMAREISMKSWRRLRLSFPCKPWGLPHGVYCQSCDFGIFWLLCLMLNIFCVWCIVMAPCWWWCIIIGFHGFLVSCFLALSFMFWVLGIVWERGNFLELWESYVVPNRWCKTQMKICGWVSTAEGKTAIVSWTGWSIVVNRLWKYIHVKGN